MIEYNQGDQTAPEQSGAGVKVIGVGGAGANVLDRMALEGSDDAALLTLNTDVRALSTSVSSDKIQLGTTLLKGMGTGGDPSLGKQAALEAVDDIREAVRGNEMVFVCVGLGGGTGSGAAPEVCRIAKEEGVFLVVFATMPFSFEGQRRMDQAKIALDKIVRYSNAVITFDNDRMGELIVPKDGVTQAFSAADKIISQSIRATMNVVFRPGIIRIGMDDLLSAIDSDDSRCLFGYGVSKGESRAHEALEQALKCPLLDRGKLLEDSNAVLVQVAGGESMTLFEVQLVMAEVAKHVGAQSQILFGTGTDKRLGNSLSVTILSSVSGPDAGRSKTEVEAAAPKLEDSAPVSLGMEAAPAGDSVSVEGIQPIIEAEVEAEATFGTKEWPFEIGGVTIKGRIDRVERHPELGTRVIDFKTFSPGSGFSRKTVDTYHLAPIKRTENPDDFADWKRVEDETGKPLRWTDLQLPIYCLAMAAEHPNTTIHAAYATLGKSETEIVLDVWETLDDRLLASAKKCAEGAVAAIKAGEFWPPNEDAPPWDDFRELLAPEAGLAVDPTLLSQ